MLQLGSSPGLGPTRLSPRPCTGGGGRGFGKEPALDFLGSGYKLSHSPQRELEKKGRGCSRVELSIRGSKVASDR